MADRDHLLGRDPGVVGRDRERARLDAFIAELPAGVRALTIRGDPGIGKTTLWRSGLESGRQAGVRTLVTRPAEEEQRLALTGLIDLFEGTEIDEEAMQSDEPFERGRAVLTVLRRLVDVAPCLVAIDDLQWLDAVSAHALRYALRRLDLEPVGIISTERAGAEGSPLDLSATLPPGRADAIDVGPLTLEETRQVLAGVVEVVSRPLLRQIQEISGGNPLYAIELGRSVARAGTIDAAGALSVRSIHATILGRLDDVPGDLAALLETMAAIGRVSVGELRSVLADLDVDGLLLDGQRQGLLVVAEELEVSFSHPLVGSAVYERMSPLSRRALHARLAEWVPDPDRRARHLARSTDDPDAMVSQFLEDAAVRAGERHASELAAELAGQSVRLTPADDQEGLRRRSLLRIGHLAEIGAVSQALEVADGLAETLPPGPARAELLVERARLESDDVATGEELLTRALEETGDDELLRGRVLDQLGWVKAVFRGDVPAGQELTREALSIAERLGDRELEMSAATGLANIELYTGSQRWELLERAVELEAEIGKPLLWAGPRVQLAMFHRIAGDLAGSRALLEATQDEALRSGKERWRPYGLYNLAGLACHEGNFVLADDLIHQALDAARDTEDPHVEAWSLYTLALVAAWLGRTDEARSTIDRILAWAEDRGERPAVARARSLLGVLLLSEGDVQAASEQLRDAVRRLDDMGIRHPAVVGAVPDAVDAFAASGHVDEAATLLARMQERGEVAQSPWVDAAIDRARGHVLSVTGAPAEAAGLLEEAAAAFERMGFAADAARSRLAQGRALRRAGQKTAAADVLADALARFQAMQTPLWQARVEEELELVAPGRAAGTLTTTEGRIAELVADGMKNKEIASALFVSVATVEAHLTRIYRKLEIRTRSELTRLVADGSIDIEGDPSEPAP